jgi:hypothetical protein
MVIPIGLKAWNVSAGGVYKWSLSESYQIVFLFSYMFLSHERRKSGERKRVLG